MSKRVGIGNIHCHHFNGDCVPDNLSKQQTGWSEKFLRGKLADILGPIFDGKNIKEFLNIMRTREIGEVTRFHERQMNDAKIDYSVILTLDFSCVDPEYHGYNISFKKQLKDTAEACASFPFRFFLFFGFEARRPGVIDLLKKAYEDYGIVGIKMYPAFGYDPRPEKNDFVKSQNVTVTDIGNVLHELYSFSKNKNLPILTHCSPGGSYQCTVDKKEKYRDIWRYTEPSNFLKIGFDYQLRICFAHMGGNVFKKGMRELSVQWFNQICNLISFSHAKGDGCRFYTDRSNALAYVTEKLLLQKHLKETKDLLSEGNYSPYILFGSDWPMALNLYNESKYINTYKTAFGQDMFLKYTSTNLADFLFGKEKLIPQNYIDYLVRNNNGKLPEIPDWIEQKNGSLKLVED